MDQVNKQTPDAELADFAAWWRARQLKTFPKDYALDRLDGWGDAYRPAAWEAWQARAALSSRPVQGGEPVAWIRYEWNKSGSKSLVFEKPAEPSLADEARGVVYEPLYAALSSAPAQPVREPMWQPIETAPKDRTEILGWLPDVGALVLYWENLSDDGRWSDGMSRFRREPTHWMPLPAAPGITKE